MAGRVEFTGVRRVFGANVRQRALKGIFTRTLRDKNGRELARSFRILRA